MAVWRPAQTIRVKALGLHWREGKLLAAEVLSDDGKIKGVRPLGGSVEFGKAWQGALLREFQEELGIDVRIISAPNVIENLYMHEGSQGHEIIFVAEVAFPTGAFAGEDSIEFFEDNGTKCVARWFDLKDLESHGIPLFPEGIAAKF